MIRITLRQLLSHRGGVFGEEANVIFMPAMWGLQGREDLSPRQRRLEAARLILRSPPVAPPGERYRYSNAGYVVAGAMLEAAGDAAWEELMQCKVFDLLGMSTAGFGPPPKIRGHLKRGDGWQPRVHDNPAILGPAGTVHASLGDWARFAAAHLGQVEGYLNEESLGVLHTAPGGDGADYALGWVVQENRGAPLLTHAGSNTMWYALIVVEREEGSAYLAVCNAPVQEACQEIVEALRDPSVP